MAINKEINNTTKTHGAMRNCIEYVLGDAKVREDLIAMTGPSPTDINWNSVYKSFVDEKKLWGKDRGRMYRHSVISFHPDEKITVEEAFDFAREFVEKWFAGFQTLFAIHMDKDHIHIHMVTNTVSYLDGHKIHTSKKDLQRMKELTNEMCRERGLSVAEKGHHFNGTSIEPGTISGWSKDKYHMLQEESGKSFVADCGLAVVKAMEGCLSREEFIDRMTDSGWHTTWEENRKHITFENENGEKVRDSNLNKTFNMNIGKEMLIQEFKRLQALQEQEERERKELEDYYADVEASIADEEIPMEQPIHIETEEERIVRQRDELGECFDFNKARDHIFPKLISVDYAKKLADENIFVTMKDDLAVTYEMRFSDFFVKVRDEMIMRYWLITPGLLEDVAVTNMAQQDPPVMKPLQSSIDRGTDSVGKEGPSMYILSSQSGKNGAASVLNTDFMDSVDIGGNYYVVPLNVYEVLLVRQNVHNLRQLLEEMQAINEAEFPPEDRISENVFIYYRKYKELIKVNSIPEPEPEQSQTTSIYRDLDIDFDH